MNGEALKGHVDALVLATLCDGPLHGYAIIDELKRRSHGTFELPEGTIYPVLHRLEADKQLASAWSDASGRRRRVYRLTRRGRTTLERRRADWQDFSRAIEAVLA